MQDMRGHTIINGLLIGNLALVAVEQTPQAVAHFAHHTFARRTQLGQIVRLLHQCIQRANLESRYVELRRVALAAYGRLYGLESFIFV